MEESQFHKKGRNGEKDTEYPIIGSLLFPS